MIPILLTAFIPITVYKVVLPFLFRPDFFGSIPWFTPNTIVYNLTYYFFVGLIVYFIAYVSCTINTLKNCRKSNWKKSMKYASYVVAWLFFGVIMINTLLLPFGKSVMLQLFRVPYALYFTDGILLTPFVYLGTLLATGYTKKEVCKKK